MEIPTARDARAGHGDVTDNVIHLDVEMTGDRRENTRRRAQAMEYALKTAAVDPMTRVRMALGGAYSQAHMGVPRTRIVHDLRQLLLDDPSLHAAAVGRQTQLRDVVAARTRGDKCGDYIGQFQLELLDEVLTPEGPDAA